MAREDPDQFDAIPRLEEYYRPRSRIVGWGERIPEGFRHAARQAPGLLAAGLFFAALLLNVPGL